MRTIKTETPHTHASSMVLCGGEPPRDSWQVAGCGHGGFGHRDCRASQDCALRVARCRRFASAAANPPSATHRPLSTPPGRGAVRPLESGRGRQGDPRALDGSCPCPPCSPPPTRTVSLPVRVAPTRCQRLMVCLGGGAAGCHSRQCANEVRLATSRPPSSVAGGRSKKKGKCSGAAAPQRTHGASTRRLPGWMGGAARRPLRNLPSHPPRVRRVDDPPVKGRANATGRRLGRRSPPPCRWPSCGVWVR